LAIAVVDDVLKQAGDLSAKAPSEVLFDVFRRKRRTRTSRSAEVQRLPGSKPTSRISLAAMFFAGPEVAYRIERLGK
jgi:hypothetical protein